MTDPGVRRGQASRTTGETSVQVELNLDGAGEYQVRTGNGMLDHLLAQLSRHGRLDLQVQARGDLTPGWHHLVEDVAVCLGRALRGALGEGRGIVRMGQALVPLDEALALVALDLGGRPYAVVEVPMGDHDLAGLSGELVQHFLETLALEARITIHARVLRGVNDHHKAEALFKALGRALHQASRPDPTLGGEAPSTKGTLD